MKDFYHIAGISRAPIYSPNSVDNDGAIFLTVLQRLEAMGHQVRVYQEEDLLHDIIQEKYIFNMVRSYEAVSKLQELETLGVVAVNSGFGIENCRREQMTLLFQQYGIPQPESIVCDLEQDFIGAKPNVLSSESSCWVKRADGHTTQANDVVFVSHTSKLPEVLEDFVKRDIDRVVVSLHMPGDLIKFYGVAGTSFFHWFYPSVAHHSKFGLEEINGAPKGITFSVEQLQTICNKAAEVLAIDVYGGDAIVAPDGTINIIDFNDWPSFAPCRQEGAKAIAQAIIQKIEKEEI